MSLVSGHSTHDRPLAPLDHEVAATAEWLFELPDGWAEQASTTMPVGLLIGEQPGPSSNPQLPLWPYPAGSAGGRLHRLSAMAVGEYLLRLARVNLARASVARWNNDQARARLHGLLSALPDRLPSGEGTRVVLVGDRARQAYLWLHGQGPMPWFQRWCGNVGPRPGQGPHIDIVSIPHTSGRNPAYRDPATVAAAGRAIRWAAGLEEGPADGG